MSENLWLYLHFPLLALESLWGNQQQPLALVNARNQLELVNPPAQQQGLEPGMALPTAYCLSPQLQTESYHPEWEQQQLQQLALQATRFSAQVYLRPPRGLVLEAASMLRWHGTLAAMWRRCKLHYQPLSLTLNLAFGHTPLNARLLAEHGLGRCRQDKPWEQQQLNRLPLSILPMNERQQRRLSAMGLQTLAELRALPGSELGYRFGPELLQWLAGLQTSNKHELTLFELPQRFRQSLHFLHDIEHSEGLLFPLKRALNQLQHFLNLRQLNVCVIHLRLHHRHQDASYWQIRSLQASHDPEHFLQLARIHCEQQQLPAPVIQLDVYCPELLPRHSNAQDLFLRQRQQTAGKLLDLLRARLGPSAVWSPQARDDPRPEHAWQPQQPGHGQAASRAPPRPLWLLPQPQPVRQQDYIHFEQPERICSGWWQDQIRRDYIRATHRNGSQHWLFRRDDGRWFWHGVFG